MYKLVLIDDEKEQVEGVVNLIDWEKYELTICGTADNGEKGLELIEATLPDIAIVDIKMPLLGGLEMLEEVSKRGIYLQSIILSGYDDFYFAQKAIELHATNYLLKPCRPEQILQSVLKVKELIIEEKKKSAILQKYQELIGSNNPILKERLMTDFLARNLHDPAAIEQNGSAQELNDVVQFTLDYIKDNYQKNINLQVMAEQVNYSPSYFSYLFKQETGTNFTDYLNHYRVEQAKKLLRDTNDKNYEIAYQVGYQDEKYFYQIFKKYTGLTASQYREGFRLNKK